MSSANVELSVVTTMYYSEPYLEDFFRRAVAAARRITPDFELVFVNDGSPDNSLEKAKSFLSSGHQVRVVDLSRNFGHHRAMMAGLAHARGRKVFLVDSDLEEDPSLLLDFNKIMATEANVDVVFGVRKKRVDSPLKKFFGGNFYKIFNRISDVKLPEDLCVVRLMTRRYVDNLMRYRETEFIIAGLWQLTGFRQIPVPIERGFKGKTTYNFKRQLNLLVNAIVAFTVRPLVFIFWLGLAISGFAGLYICYLVYLKFALGIPQSGFVTTAASIWLLGGLNLFGLGIVGFYIAMIYKEVKRRPLVIVRDVFEN